MIFIGLAVAVFTTEYFIKRWIEKNKSFESKDSILGDRVIIRKHHNKGTAGQFLEKYQGLISVLAFIFTIIMALVFAFTLTKHGNNGLKTGLALLLGGAFSNTYDRLKRKYVVDYISLKVKGKLGTLVFNIADFCIMIGALMVCVFQK